MYLAGCFKSSVGPAVDSAANAFLGLVISHSHLTVFGTFVVWAMGGLVYVGRGCVVASFGPLRSAIGHSG